MCRILGPSPRNGRSEDIAEAVVRYVLSHGPALARGRVEQGVGLRGCEPDRLLSDGKIQHVDAGEAPVVKIASLYRRPAVHVGLQVAPDRTRLPPW